MMKFRMQQFKLIVLAVAAGMVGPAFSEVTVSVESGERRLSASDISALGSSEDLVKTGTGRLVIDSALFPAGWTGAVKVNGGYLRVAHVGGLGPAGAKGAVVASGATIEFDGSALGTESLTCPKVAFQGTGADGVSAVRTVNANWEHKNMHWTLTGDATWGGASSKGELFRSGGSASIDMNGHKLTVRGNGTKNSIYFYTQVEKLIKNPGDIDVMDGVYFVTENMLFPGGSGHTLTFKDSCSWRITNNNKDQMTWKMVIEEGVAISWAAADWVTKYPNGTSRGWSGPIEIKSGARLSWSPGKNGSNPDEKIACTISGPISGDGEMALINNYLILDNKDNSIANILNYQGHLIATSLSAVLPSFTNGTFIGRYCNETGTRIMLAESEMGAVCDGAIQYYLTNYPAAYKYRYNDGSHSNPNIHIAGDDYGKIKKEITRLQELYADKNFLILKHDVETNPQKALALAKIENRYGHCGVYYVQAYLLKDSNNVEILKKISELGHEVSYHHDVMDSNSGDLAKAMDEFESNRCIFEKYGFSINTVCQHGNPVVERNGYTSNRDFFRNETVRKKYGEIAEIMVNYREKVNADFKYISDAGYGYI